MTSWEDVINQVVIPGDPGAVSSASAEWTVVFQRIREAKRYLNDGLVDLEAWEGEAGQTYRDKVGLTAQKLGTLDTENSGITAQLDTAAAELTTAINNIPIPAEMIHDVVNAREEYRGSGTLSGFGPDFIYERMRGFYESGFLGAVASIPGVGSALTGLRNWITDNDEEAVRHYNALNGEYANVAAGIPAGSTPPGMIQPSFEPIPNTPLGTGGAPGGLPGTGSAGGVPGGGFDPPGTPGTLGGTGSIDPPGSTGLDDPGGSFTDPDLDTGTGLAGAGDGGISGAGLGGGGGGGAGLGGGGISGAGVGGGGAGGLGAGALGRAAGLGPLTSPMPGMAGMLGGGGAAGGGARGGRGGLGAGRGMAGMMGAPMAGGGHCSEDEHSTWLQEDDDVWGTDTGAPPSLLT